MKSLLENGIISRKISNTIINGRNRNVSFRANVVISKKL